MENGTSVPSKNTPEALGNRPENQGIDQFFGFWHGSRNFTAGVYNESNNLDSPLQLRYLREALIHPDDSKTDIVKEYSDYANIPSAEKDLTKILGNYAENFVADHHADAAPFFLYLAHPAPHKPWTNNSPDYNDPRISSLTPNNRRQVASMMITMDKEIGDLMAKLDDPNGDGNTADSIKDNTLVVFLNDNGGVAGMENGVNLIPHLNGSDTNPPHEVLVHRWRGTFAVIRDNWKLVNTRNSNASPPFYKLYDLTTDPSEANDISGVGSNAAHITEMTREVTHMESRWDKPRYPILARTLSSEPLNLVNHFTFRPGLHNNWSAGAPEQSAATTEPANWYEGGTTNPLHLLRSDGFSGAILEFPAHPADYSSNNDLLRKTGLEFMLNKIILSGNDASNKTTNLNGNDLIFTNNLAGEVPRIEINSTGNFTYDLDINLILYHDLIITGDGTASLKIDGDVSQFFDSRGTRKTGTSNAEINRARTYSGDTNILGGNLKIAQINTADNAATYRLATSSILDLTFVGTDAIDKLFLDGIQQPAGVYGAEIAQITGTGTLTVISGPANYSTWADQNAPGSTFTMLPVINSSGNITWPISSSYSGTYGNDFYLETSPDLFVEAK